MTEVSALALVLKQKVDGTSICKHILPSNASPQIRRFEFNAVIVIIVFQPRGGGLGGFAPPSQRVSPHSDRSSQPSGAHPAASSDSTIRERASSTSSRRSDSSRRSQERVTPSNSRPSHIIDPAAESHRHRDHDHQRPLSRNQMSRHEGSCER